MSIDVDVLVETYTVLTQYIPAKERQEAADNLVSMFNDAISDKELREFGLADKYTSSAVKEYIGDDDEEDYSDYEE